MVVLLAAAVGVALIAWFAASKLEQNTMARQRAAGEIESGAVLSDGVLFEATAGDPGFVIAKEVGSGKELWRAELGAVATQPAITIVQERVEVQIAGTPWMTLDRDSGEPLD